MRWSAPFRWRSPRTRMVQRIRESDRRERRPRASRDRAGLRHSQDAIAPGRRSRQPAGAAVLLVALALASRAPAARAARPRGSRCFPHSIEIAVQTGDARVPAGSRSTIAATVQGRGAPHARRRARRSWSRRTASSASSRWPRRRGLQLRLRIRRSQLPVPGRRRLVVVAAVHRHGAVPASRHADRCRATSIRRSRACSRAPKRTAETSTAPAGHASSIADPHRQAVERGRAGARRGSDGSG